MVRGRRGTHREVVEAIQKAGFVRVRVDGTVYPIDDMPALVAQKTHDIEAVVDRVVIRPGIESRLAESVRLALKHGDGVVLVVYQTPESKAAAGEPASAGGRPKPTPGKSESSTPATPAPTAAPASAKSNRAPSASTAPTAHAPPATAWASSSPKALNKPIRQRHHQNRRPHACRFSCFRRRNLPRLPRHPPPPRSPRLPPRRPRHPRNHRPLRRRRPRILPATDVRSRSKPIAQPIVAEIVRRLDFLMRVGTDYLTLDRPADTLSGGERQRVRLATGIGSGLVGVLYLLDEPSIGLHPRDNDRLIAALRELAAAGQHGRRRRAR